MEQTPIAQGPVDVTVGRRPDIYLAFSDNGEHIRFWTASEGHAREWALENWETEPFFSGAQMNRALAEIERLRAGIVRAQDLIILKMPTAALGCLDVGRLTPGKD